VKAGHKLDALVAEKVMGWFKEVDFDYKEYPQHNWRDKSGFTAIANHPDQMPGLPMWSPSSDIKAAWDVAEKAGLGSAPVPGGWVAFWTEDAFLSSEGAKVSADGQQMGYIGYIHENVYRPEVYRTAPLAICHTALKYADVKAPT
jgi:hypothetical protein